MKVLKKMYLSISLLLFMAVVMSSCNKDNNVVEFVGFGTVESFGTVIKIDVKEGEKPLYLRGTMLNSMLLSDGQRVFVYGTIDQDNQTENKAMLTNFSIINPFPTLDLSTASITTSDKLLNIYEPWVTYNDGVSDYLTIHCEALLENKEDFTYFLYAVQTTPYQEGDDELNIGFYLELTSEVTEGYRSPVFRSIRLPFGANNNPGKPIKINIQCNTQTTTDCANYSPLTGTISIEYNRKK